MKKIHVLFSAVLVMAVAVSVPAWAQDYACDWMLSRAAWLSEQFAGSSMLTSDVPASGEDTGDQTDEMQLIEDMSLPMMMFQPLFPGIWSMKTRAGRLSLQAFPRAQTCATGFWRNILGMRNCTNS